MWKHCLEDMTKGMCPLPESLQQSSRLEVHITVTTMDVQDDATLRTGQLDDNDMEKNVVGSADWIASWLKRYC